LSRRPTPPGEASSQNDIASQVFPEPHSTKQIEDCVAWGLDTTPETLILTMLGGDTGLPDVEAVEALCRSIECPAVVVHGSADAVIPVTRGQRVAELTGAEFVRFELEDERARHDVPAARRPPHCKPRMRVERFAGDGRR
jgi:pimeloyl-ACP methyl ester carboxylesterase